MWVDDAALEALYRELDLGHTLGLQAKKTVLLTGANSACSLYRDSNFPAARHSASDKV